MSQRFKRQVDGLTLPCRWAGCDCAISFSDRLSHELGCEHGELACVRCDTAVPWHDRSAHLAAHLVHEVAAEDADEAEAAADDAKTASDEAFIAVDTATANLEAAAAALVQAEADKVEAEADIERLVAEAATTAADWQRLAAEAGAARVTEAAQVAKDKATAEAKAARRAAAARAEARLRHMRSLLPRPPPEMPALAVDPAAVPPMAAGVGLQRQLTEHLQGLMCDDTDRQFKVTEENSYLIPT